MPKSVGFNLSCIALAAISWGVGGFVAAILYHRSGLGPIAVTFWRYAGGLALLAALRPLLRTSGTRRPKPRRLILNGLGMALYQTTYYVAIALGGVGMVTVVTLGSGPILIAIGARLFLGERMGRTGALTVGASVVGLTLLVAQNPQTGPHPLAGMAVALVSAAGYAGVTLLNRAESDDPYDSALAGFAIGTAALLPLAAFEGPLPHAEHLGETLALLAFLGAIPTALAYALFFQGLRVVRATTASVVALSEPLAAVALGALVLHEPLTPWSAAGGATLLAAVAALALQERRARDGRVRPEPASEDSTAAAVAPRGSA
ncbi:DMT family transporter [Dactylosporangium matsuzakiense]|uniref:Membrane protein n=1 Tax=Dactylosporangium matsuzakiense TaxID=53360 RepID=A0A9W6KC63_9ACTN|nr:DMT family transporter [Dactylosporangium matsuzakiense]UWZ45406.1 EamA family transporter [Dactylosporangium matsuzakiense]GLK98607.1 membrane protein [Dactylosporangium matsuzakiense]